MFMNNLHYRIDTTHLKAVFAVPDSWGISFLYLCCSGSFLGFAFAFGQLLQHNFVASGQSYGQASLHAAEIAFIGPLLGSVARIVGGRLSDRFGGGRVALALLAGMILGGAFVVGVSTHDDFTHGPAGRMTFATLIAYIGSFIWLFIFSGAGKAAVYKLIPSVFEERSRALDVTEVERREWARVMSGSLIGLAGACGALGGVGINMALRQSYRSTGTETPAFLIFLGCYVLAAVLIWARYVRPRHAASRTSVKPAWEMIAEEPVSP